MSFNGHGLQALRTVTDYSVQFIRREGKGWMDKAGGGIFVCTCILCLYVYVCPCVSYPQVTVS